MDLNFEVILTQRPKWLVNSGVSLLGVPPQISADQLTLSQPGGHILPTQYYEPPGFSDLAMALQTATWIFANICKKKNVYVYILRGNHKIGTFGK